MIEKLIRFGVVGLTGVVIDFAITWLFKERLKVNKFISNGIGFTIAASSNYLFNRIWTFESTDPHIANQYFTFLLISITGLAINTLLLYLLTNKKVAFYLAKLIAIAVVTLWNFFMNYFITFS